MTQKTIQHNERGAGGRSLTGDGALRQVAGARPSAGA